MFSGIKNYFHDQLSLIKLEGVETIGKVSARIVFITLVLLFAMFFLLLLSLAGGFYLGSKFGMELGFLMISGVYIIIIALLFVFKKPIQKMLVDVAIEASMNRDNDDE